MVSKDKVPMSNKNHAKHGKDENNIIDAMWVIVIKETM